MTIDQLVEIVEENIEDNGYDCSVCPFADMSENGIVNCGTYEVFNDDGEYECQIDKEYIKNKIIEIVKGELNK